MPSVKKSHSQTRPCTDYALLPKAIIAERGGWCVVENREHPSFLICGHGRAIWQMVSVGVDGGRETDGLHLVVTKGDVPPLIPPRL